MTKISIYVYPTQMEDDINGYLPFKKKKKHVSTYQLAY